jgi:hypothetical protein
MTISQKAIDELKRNNKLKGLVAIAHGCTVYTIDRWIRTGSIKNLTAAVVIHMNIIKQETGLETEDILVVDDQN